MSETNEETKEQEEEQPAAKAEKGPLDFDAKAFEDRITAAVARQISQLRVELTPKEQTRAVKRATDEIDWDEFYSNPVETMERFAKRIRDEVTSDIVSRYQQETGNRDFWTGFYAENPHLRAHGEIVEAILVSKEQAWRQEGITVGEAYKRLGVLTDAIGGKLRKEEKGEEDFSGMVDGLAYVSSPQKGGEEKIRSLSDIIRERQSRWRSANSGRRSKS